MYGKNEKEKKLNILINEKNREKIEKVLTDFQRSYKTRTIDERYIFAEAKNLSEKFNNLVPKNALKGCSFDWMPYAEEKLPNAYKYNSSALATAITIEFTGTDWKLTKISREQMERKKMIAYYSQKFMEVFDLLNAFEDSIDLSEFPNLETPEEKAEREERLKLRDEANIDFSKFTEYHDITLRIGPASTGFLTAVGRNWYGNIASIKSFLTYQNGRTCKAHIIPPNAEIPGHYYLRFVTKEEILRIYGSDGDYMEFENKGGFEIYTSGSTGIIIKYM